MESRDPESSIETDTLQDSLDRGYRYALSLTHDPTEAEDLVQEAVTAMLRKGASWERPYLFATIRNRFIDACRRRKTLRFVSMNEEIDANGESFRDFESPDVFDYLESRLLHEALGTLRPDERETLFLAVVEGYTAEEIARLRDRPRGTVLSLLFRAKRKLRARLSAIPHAVRAGAIA